MKPVVVIVLSTESAVVEGESRESNTIKLDFPDDKDYPLQVQSDVESTDSSEALSMNQPQNESNESQGRCCD